MGTVWKREDESWTIVTNPDDILELPTDDLYFSDLDQSDSAKELKSILDSKMGLPIEISRHQNYRGRGIVLSEKPNIKQIYSPSRKSISYDYDLGEYVLLDEFDKIPRIIELVKEFQPIDLPYEISNMELLLARHGVVREENGFIFDEKKAQKIIKDRKSKPKTTYQSNPQHIYNSEIDNITFQVNKAIRESIGTYFNPIQDYGVRSEVCARAIAACDLYSYIFGKGTYRGLDSVKTIKAKWKKVKVKTEKKNRLPEFFINFLNDELKRGSPGKGSPKDRSLIVKFL